MKTGEGVAQEIQAIDTLGRAGGLGPHKLTLAEAAKLIRADRANTLRWAANRLGTHTIDIRDFHMVAWAQVIIRRMAEDVENEDG